MTRPKMVDLSEIRAALAAAYPGPYAFCYEQCGTLKFHRIHSIALRQRHAEAALHEPTARLIASAPAWLALLVDRVEQLERQVMIARAEQLEPKKNNWCKGFCRTCGTGCGEYCEQIRELQGKLAVAHKAQEKNKCT